MFYLTQVPLDELNKMCVNKHSIS